MKPSDSSDSQYYFLCSGPGNLNNDHSLSNIKQRLHGGKPIVKPLPNQRLDENLFNDDNDDNIFLNSEHSTEDELVSNGSSTGVWRRSGNANELFNAVLNEVRYLDIYLYTH
jgi:hypothetical protein